jgi:Ca2+-binding RTX toxin-like protein
MSPTITLPDGKYRVDVTIGVAATSLCTGATGVGNIINGTTGQDNIDGTAGVDTIYGNGGNDRIISGDGNDTIIAGNPNTAGATSVLVGGSGCDTITAGDLSYNVINGTDFNVAGVGEKDVLTGGGIGSENIYIIGDVGCSDTAFYFGNNDNDFAQITNFNKGVDKIQFILYNLTDLTYSNGVTYIYRSGDLIAKVTTTAPLDLTDFQTGGCY